MVRGSRRLRDHHAGTVDANFPLPEWLRGYRRADLGGDAVAGVVVAIMLVPQAMAYAQLAGLPPEAGLYASMAPLVVYALLGTSRTLAVGPVAIDSLLVAAGLAPLVAAGGDAVELALTLALLVGAIDLVLGLARLGFLANFLSHPVMSGFTTAAVLVIALSQAKHLLGVPIEGMPSSHELVLELVRRAPDTNLVTLAIGLGTVVLLLLFRYGVRAWLVRLGVRSGLAQLLGRSGPLVALVAGTLVVRGLALDSAAGVRVVGAIPTGLPHPTLPELETARALLPTALAICLVGFLEAYSTGRALASKRRQKLDATRELVALGGANVAAAFTGGYPVTGGLARSTVNFAAGANTPLASILTALLVAVVVAFLTPLLHSLPQAVLAAIIVVALTNLVDLRALRHVWRYSKADGLAMTVTFATSLVFPVQWGILVGTTIALLLYLWRTSQPHVAVLGRVGTSEHFRNVRRHEVETDPRILVLRVDENLYFPNAKFLEDTLLRAVADRPEVRYVVLVCSAVSFVDTSALDTIERLDAELRDGGVVLLLSEVKGPVSDRLDRVGFLERFGRDRVFLSTHAAVTALEGA